MPCSYGANWCLYACLTHDDASSPKLRADTQGTHTYLAGARLWLCLFCVATIWEGGEIRLLQDHMGALKPIPIPGESAKHCFWSTSPKCWVCSLMPEGTEEAGSPGKPCDCLQTNLLQVGMRRIPSK